MRRVCVAETGTLERTQDKRANAKQKCHRKGDWDASVEVNRKVIGDSCHSLLLTPHFHSSLPSQRGATLGTLTQIMAGSVEVCEEGPDGVQWRRLERKRRWLSASVPVLSTGVPRVLLHSHLLLSAVSSSLNLLLSEHTVPHGIVCAVTCPKGEERKGTRGSGSKTSVKPETTATRRSSRHNRAEDSSPAQSQPSDSDTTPQTVNDTPASTSRGQQGNNPRSGAKRKGRGKKKIVERHEDEEVGNHEEDEEAETDQKASPDQIDRDQEPLDMEEKMEVENETSPTEANNQDDETVKVEEIATESMVQDEDDQILSQDDSEKEVEMDDSDRVELENVANCQSRSSAEPDESQSDSQDVQSPLQEESTAEAPTVTPDQIVDVKPELDTQEDQSDKRESSCSPPLQDVVDLDSEADTTDKQESSSFPALRDTMDLKSETDNTQDNADKQESSSFPALREFADQKPEPDTTEDKAGKQKSTSFPALRDTMNLNSEADTAQDKAGKQESSSFPALREFADQKPKPDTTGDNADKQESSSLPALREIADQKTEPDKLESSTFQEDQSAGPSALAIPETKDTNASPQDNTDLIPMECDSPAPESEAEANPTVNVAQTADPKPKTDGSKEAKGLDKSNRDGRSRRSRFHSPTTTWSPTKESKSDGSRRSRSRSRDRSHKTRSTSRSREQGEEREGRRSRSRERSHRRRSRSRNRNRAGRQSPSQERSDHGGHSPRKRESWGTDGWRSTGGGRGFRNSNWRNNAEKPGNSSTREHASSDNGSFNEASPDRSRGENPDWVKDRERLYPDADARGREPRLGDPPSDSWCRGGWSAGRGRGGANWSSSQQSEPADNWRQRTPFSGTANNTDSYSRFNENRGKRKECDGGETAMDRSGWSSASSWAVRRTLPADVQNYYSRRDRGGGNNSWNRQEEEQGAPGVPKQADPPQNEPNAPLPAEAVPAPPPALMPHQLGVMGVMRYPMAPLLPRPPAVGLQPPQFSLPPPGPVQLHPAGPLLQVPSIAVQGLPPPPPPPPPVQAGFTIAPPESHPSQQVMPSFSIQGKASFKPMPTKVVAGPVHPMGAVSASQPSSTTQPTHSKAHADSSKKEKKLQIQERAANEVKAAIKPYYQKNEINKEEYKEIVRKAVEKVCHSKSGEVNADKVANLVKAYVDKYKRTRKNKSE